MRYFIKLICSTIFFAGSLLVGFAQKGSDPVSVQALIGEKGEIFKGKTFTCVDPKFGDSLGLRSTIIHTNWLKNRVSLKFDENYPLVYTDSFEVAVWTHVKLLKEDGVEQSFDTVLLNLKIDPRSGKKQIVESYFTAKDGWYIEVTIDSVWHNANWDVMKALTLRSEVEASRQYTFRCNNSIDYLSHYDAAKDELAVTWSDPNGGQSDYEIEWAWVDAEAAAEYQDNSTNTWIPERVFPNNCTRVTIPGNRTQFNIPLLYDGHGFILIRMRYVQEDYSGYRVESVWNSNLVTGVGLFEFDGHENDLNWQATTSYAEDGKHKSVIQYFDGTLRSRQTVTKDNSETDEDGISHGRTLIAETLYDYQGRPTIQILPAPSLSTAISYIHNFNRSVANNHLGYGKELYDQVNSTTQCNDGAPAFEWSDQNGSGAAAYYSSKYLVGNRQFNGLIDYLPKAYGFPFTETRYTQDGTGRIAAQGGVGVNHQLGSNHETKYYYSTPTQEELDALFGTDVGDASHYFKQTVVDANGQFSISYQDMAGRTIATALEGESPANLQALDNQTSGTGSSVAYSQSLLNRNNNVIRGNTIEMTRDFVITSTGNVAFHYKMDPGSLIMDNCISNPPQPICYDCLYDLEIIITGECGNAGLPNQEPFVMTPVINFSLDQNGDYNSTCAPQGFDVNFSVQISQKGNYTITKRLTINKPQVDKMRELVYLPNNSCKSLQTFLAEYHTAMVNSNANCQLTCESCETVVNAGVASFIQRFKEQMQFSDEQMAPYLNDLNLAFQSITEDCSHICYSSNSSSLRAKNYRKLLLEDMRPDGGQYAQLRKMVPGANGIPEPSNTETAFSEPFNIFNPQLNSGPYYLHPRTETGMLDQFRNQYNQVDEDADQSLSGWSPVQFTEHFKESWSNQLIYYHPEFKKLQAYEMPEFSTAVKWGEVMGDKQSWAEASAQAVGLPDSDPFMSLGFIDNDIKNALISKFNAYQRVKVLEQTYLGLVPIPSDEQASITMGMWRFAVASVRCQSYQDLAQQRDCLKDASITNTIGNFPEGTCDADRDAIWKAFWAFYNRERELLIQNHLEKVAPLTAEIRQSLANKQLRFITPDIDLSAYLPDNLRNLYAVASSGGSGISGEASDALKQQYIQTCSDYIPSWRMAVEQAIASYNTERGTQITPSEEAYQALMTQLKNICVSGSDLNHPLGSSSVSPGNAGDGPNSFDVALRQFLTDLLITDYTPDCHPYILNWPNPYNAQVPLGNEVITTIVPDACICTRLKQLESNFNIYKDKYPDYTGDFSQYIGMQYGASISMADLESIRTGCQTNPDPTCHYLSQPIVVPPVLQCGAAEKPCIECIDLEKLISQFKDQFHLPENIQVPVITPKDELEARWNLLFAQFANYRTGFAKQWFEYAEFLQMCGLNCEELFTVKNTILTDPDYYASSNEGCIAQFVIRFNSILNRNLSWEQIRQLYIDCGDCNIDNEMCVFSRVAAKDIEADFIGYVGTVGNAPYEEGVDLSIGFTGYYNASHATSIVFDEIEKIYEALTSGNNLNVNDRFNSIRLKHAASQYNLLFPGIWQTATCESTLVNYLNAYFGVSFDLSNWNVKYSDAGLVMPSCNPPFNCNDLSQTLQLFYNQYGQTIGDSADCYFLFTDFFNQQRGTSYLIYDLKQLYLTICNSELGLCQPDLNCEKLTTAYEAILAQHPDLNAQANCGQMMVTYLNQQLGQNYSLKEWKNNFTFYCNMVPDFCNEQGYVASAAQLEGILYSFRMIYPNPRASFGEGCIEAYANYLNSMVNGSYSVQGVIDLHLTLTGRPLDICELSQCQSLISYSNVYKAKYLNYHLPKNAIVTSYTTFFNQWYGAKEALNYKDIQDLYKTCGATLELIEEAPENVGDSSVLMSVKLMFDELHTVAGSDNVTEQFVTFFNLSMRRTSSYEEIEQYYQDSAYFNLDAYLKGIPKTVRSSGHDIQCPVSRPRLCGLNEVPAIDTEEDDPCTDAERFYVSAAVDRWELYQQQILGQFDQAYQDKCLSAASIESLTMTVEVPEKRYQFTLYYYDQAGNLVKTVPPAGVQANFSNSFLNQVKQARLTNTDLPVNHQLITEYRYNTLGQVVVQKTPDAGMSKFWYDELGRLILSQNAEQETKNSYSYTVYDELGRISMVGEKVGALSATPINQAFSRDAPAFKNWLFTGAGVHHQITRTVYDVSYFSGDNLLCPNDVLCQHNLRNRVSYTQLFKDPITPDNQGNFNFIGTHQAATYYTYDLSGNVSELLQDLNMGEMAATGNRYKRLKYDYDLISGKVNEVAYQPGATDQFLHRYEYDGENRLTAVYTSLDGQLWERDATYSYYLHGPLKRMELGQQRVQGVDYAYTIQGWLKGVNSSAILSDNDGAGATNWDIGEDGKPGSGNAFVARDVYGFSLNYFAGDYEAAGQSSNPRNIRFVGNVNDLSVTNTTASLFNGNISSMLVNIPKLGEAQLYGYRYDQLNRIVGMEVFHGLNGDNDWGGSLNHHPASYPDQRYREAVSYDPNGNIQSYLRNGDANRINMDQLSYVYYSGTNRLKRVTDAAPNVAPPLQYSDYNDFRKKVPGPGDDPEENPGDPIYYVYDKIGNLIEDKLEKLKIEWNVYGKIDRILKNTSAAHPNGETIITYSYDASGNRVEKRVENITTSEVTYTYYLRDASGNVMAVYEKNSSQANATLALSELHLYGSSRLGIQKVEQQIPISETTGSVIAVTRGIKFFELTNHLQNVLVTVSDKKIGVDADNNGQIDYYTADVTSAQDFYPGGMDMPGRQYNAATGYRIGFNGKEKDKEVVQYDYGFRIYDPRLVRFKSVDPLTKEYPWYTPYQFAGNSPIQNIDLDGLEEVYYSYMMIDGYRTKLVHEQAEVKAIPKEGAISSFFSGIKTKIKNWWNSSRAEPTQGVLGVTDIDDASVLLYDQHIDGQEATLVDKGLTLVPFVGGKVAKKLLKKAEYLKYLKGNGLTSKVATAVVERGALRGALKIAKGSADIAHHIIPVKLLKENKVVQSAVEAGFDFNSATNGVAINKALHGSHPNYSNFVQKELDDWAKAHDGYSAKDAREFIQNTLVPKLETMIDKAKQSSTTLQEAFKTP